MEWRGMALPWRVLSAVILAAGDSSRMGTPKAALLTPDGDSFVARLVRTLREAHVHDLVIVTGRHHDEVIDALTRRYIDDEQIASLGQVVGECRRLRGHFLVPHKRSV